MFFVFFVLFFNLLDFKILNFFIFRFWMSLGFCGGLFFIVENFICFNGFSEFEEELFFKECFFLVIFLWMVRLGDIILFLGLKFWWKRIVFESVLLELELRFRIFFGVFFVFREFVFCLGKDGLLFCFKLCDL